MRSREELITTVFHTPWHFMRWARLIIGGWAIANFVTAFRGGQSNMMEFIVLGLGIYFIYKALFNTGCETSRYQSQNTDKSEDNFVDYTEIK